MRSTQLITGSLIRSGAKRSLLPRWVWMKSQPMWAWKRPRMAPAQPWPWSTWGLCGSPSSSEKAWCLRWSATQEITGPSIAAEPRIASSPCSQRLRLEGAVGEVAVEADRDPEAGEQVHADEEEDVAPVQGLAPDLPAGEAERDEGDQR